jgi:hypothetical protein
MPQKHQERSEICKKNGIFCNLKHTFGRNFPKMSHNLTFFSAKNSDLNLFYHRNFTKNTLFQTNFHFTPIFLTAFVQRFPPHATPKPAVNDDDALQPNHRYYQDLNCPSCHPLFSLKFFTEQQSILFTIHSMIEIVLSLVKQILTGFFIICHKSISSGLLCNNLTIINSNLI